MPGVEVRGTVSGVSGDGVMSGVHAYIEAIMTIMKRILRCLSGIFDFLIFNTQREGDGS